MGAIELQVLGTGLQDGPGPAVLLSFPTQGYAQPLYLFNAPEGLSRFALEHRLLRPARGQLAAVFWTGVEHDGIAGLSGIVMRGRTDGAGKCHVVGPKGVVGQLHALRHLMRWKYPTLLV